MNKQPFIQKPKPTGYKPKTYVPNVKVEETVVRDFFLAIAQNDKSSINKLINIDSYVINSQNNGESALYAALNSESSDDDKADLVKFLVAKGAGVNTRNSQNMTPLHKACELQLSEVVDILLEKHADINAQDNNKKTPLHYLLSAFPTECEKDNTPKALISKTTKTLDNTQIAKLNSEIIDYIGSNSEIKSELDTMRNYIKISNELFAPEFKEIEKNILNDLIKRATNPNLSSVEQKDLTKIAFEVKKIVVSKLDELYNVKQVNQDNIDAKSISDVIIKKNQENIDGIIKELDNTFNELLKKATNIENELIVLKENIFDVVLLENALHVNHQAEYVKYSIDIRDFLYRDTSDKNIFDYKYVYSNELPFYNTRHYFDLESPEYKISINDKEVVSDKENFYRVNMTDVVKAKKYFLTDDSKNNESSEYSGKILPEMKDIYRQNIPIVYNDRIGDHTDHLFNRTLLITTMPTFHVLRIKKNITMMKSYINNLKTDKNMYVIFNDVLPLIIIYNLNIIINIINCKHYLNNIPSKLMNIINKATEVYNLGLSHGFYAFNIGFITESIIANSKLQSKNLDNLYEDCKSIVKTINKLIIAYNNHCAGKYIEKYIAKEKYNVGFDRSIGKVQELAEFYNIKLDKFIDSKNYVATQKYLLEQYLPFINRNNYFSYITSIEDITEYVNYTNTYDVEQKWDSHIITLTTPKIGYLNPHNIYLNISILEIKDTLDNKELLESKVPILEGLDTSTKMGKIGIIDERTYKEKILPIVSSKINSLMEICKINIINKVKENAFTVKKDILEIIPEENKEVVYNNLIIDVTDNTLNVFLKTAYNNFANDYVNGKYPTENITTSQPTIANIQHTDYGFKLKLDEIIYSITEHIDQKNAQQLNFTADLLEDQENNIQSLLFVPDAGLKKTNDLCYKIDEMLIEKLLKKPELDINITDKNGMSVIFYSIDMPNENIVNKIYNSTRKNSLYTKNKNGKTPIEYTKTKLLTHYIEFGDIEKQNKKFYREVKQSIKGNELFKKNYILYIDIVFPFVFTLINNYFYGQFRNYRYGTNTEYTALLAELKEKDLTEIPLIEMSDEDWKKYTTPGIKVIDRIIEKSSKDKPINEANKKNADDTHNFLIEEGKTATIERNLEIKGDTKTDYQSKINENDAMIQKFKNINDNINNTTKTNKISSTASNINPLNIYEKIFLEKLNNEKPKDSEYNLLGYSELWKAYIRDKNRMNKINNFHISLVEYQKNILNNITKQQIENIKKVYNYMSKTSRDYLSLPYKENIVQMEIIKYIAHVSKHTILTIFYYTITKALANYLLSVEIQDKDKVEASKNIINKIKQIIDDSKILDYLLGEMSIRIVKVHYQLFDDNDIEATLRLEDVFNKIYEKLPELGSFTTELKNTIIPFFTEYTIVILDKLKPCIDTYFKNIIYENKMLNILNLLIQ